MACKVKPVTAKARVRAALLSKGVIDRFNHIIDMAEFNRLNSVYSKDATDRFNVPKRLLIEENGQAFFNMDAFYAIDAKKGIFYPENKHLQDLNFQLKDLEAINNSPREISQEKIEILTKFLQKVNPDFRIEILDEVNDGQGISVNGVLKLNEFLIELKKGKISALPEEVAHVLVEMLDKNTDLYKELMSDITLTKMYKEVLRDYGNHPEYKGNVEKLKREAVAKLISLYVFDNKLAKYYTGSSTLINKVFKLFKDIFRTLAGRKIKSPFTQAAMRILSLETRDLLYANALESEHMYQMDKQGALNVLETLKKDTDGKLVYVNINDTILDLKKYSPNERIGKKSGKLLTSKAIKSAMWKYPDGQDLKDYFNNAALTELGKELKDKWSYYQDKVIFYTTSPQNSALDARLNLEFGDHQIVRSSSTQYETLIDEDGNEILNLVPSDTKDILKNHIGDNQALVVDNVKNDVFYESLPNVETTLFNNEKFKERAFAETRASRYKTIKEREEEIKRIEEINEFSENVYAEFEKLDQDTILKLAKPALNLVQNILTKIENGESEESLLQVFSDEHGNTILPLDRARLVLKQIEDEGPEYREGLLNFINTMASTTLFWKNSNKGGYKNLLKLAEGSKEDVNEAIDSVAKLMRFVLNWEDFLKSIQPLIAEDSFTGMTVIPGVLSNLSYEISTAKGKINKIAVEVISKQIAGAANSYNATKKALLDSGKITQEQYNESIVTPQSIADIIYGKKGDLSLTSYFENSLFSGNDLVQTIGYIVEKSLTLSNVESFNGALDITKELNDIQENSGMSHEEIGEKIVYVDQENFFEQQEDGTTVMKQRDVLMFHSQFKNVWQYDAEREKVNVALRSIKTARQSGDETLLKAAQDNYETVFNNFKTWEKENWNRELFTEPSEIYKSFGLEGEDLDRGEEAQQVVKDKIKAVQAELRQSHLSYFEQKEKQKELQMYFKELKDLRNIWDFEDNREKIEHSDPVKDIRVAKALKLKHIIDRQLYKYTVNEERFIKDLRAKILEEPTSSHQILYSGIGKEKGWLKDFMTLATSVGTTSLLDWLEQNTKTIYDEEFYEERKEILSILGESIEKLGKFQTELARQELQELNKKVQSKWEDIFNLSSSLRDEDGIFDASETTLEHQQRVMDAQLEIEDLKLAVKAASVIDATLTEEQEEELASLQTIIRNMIEELMNIQEKNPTVYYNQTMFSRLENIYPKELGGVYVDEDFQSLINSDAFAEWFRFAQKSQDPEHKSFVEWFITNHFHREYESEGEVKYTYMPTYIWMKIKPSNEKHIQLIPGFKYSIRDYKDSAEVEYDGQKKHFQLKTEKNENTWDELNQKWLPKRNSTFVNTEFAKLAGTKEGEYLRKLTSYLQKSQLNSPKSSRLGYKVPTMHKRYTEGNGLRTLWKQAGDRLNPVESGEANASKEEKQTLMSKIKAWVGLETLETKQQVINTDLLGNKIEKIYTPYTLYLNPADVTRDTLVASTAYVEGLNKTKALMSNFQELTLLEQLLDQFSPFEQNTVNRNGESVPTHTNRLSTVIKNIKKTKLYGDTKDFELGENVDMVTRYMRKYTVMLSQSILSPANAVKNYLQSQMTNYISAGVADWADSKSVAKAIASKNTSYVKYLADLKSNNRNLDFQIITLFNLHNSGELSEKLTSSGFKRETDLTKLGMLSSAAVEFTASTTLLYAHLYHKKVKVNGEEVSLYDAFELHEGKLRIKPGTIDLTTNKEFTEDSLTELMVKAKVINEHVQGKQWNPTIMQRYTIFKNLEFFKSFFIPKIRERFVTKRKNIAIGEDIEGYYITFFKRFLREVISLIETGKLTGIVASTAERRANQLMLKELVAMVATYLLITFVFGFDDDDKDRYKKLKDNSWATNFMLLSLLNAKRETDALSMIPLINTQENLTPPLITETWSFVTNPFIGFGLFNRAKDLLNAAASIPFDSGYYDRDIDSSFIEKGDSKFVKQIEKLVGMDALMMIGTPEYKIRNTMQMANLN